MLSVRNKATNVVNETSVVKSVANFIDDNGVIVVEKVQKVVESMHDSLCLQRKDK